MTPPATRQGSSSKTLAKTSQSSRAAGSRNVKTPWSCLECDDGIIEEEETIECHRCKNWCHKQCSMLSEAQYAVLARGGGGGGGGGSLLWQCQKCIVGGAARNSDATRTEAKLDVLTKLLQDMVERLEKLEKANGEKSIDEKIEAAVERKMTHVLEEAKEKEKRKHNIIVVNLPESLERTPEERKREDEERVRELIGKVTDVPRGEIGDPIRLGPIRIGQNPRPRLLRMVVRTEEAKNKIMRNVYALNEGVPFDKRVYINHDNTPHEREKYRELKTEMQRRMENGERDLVIRNMKITKRQNRYVPDAGNPQ